MLLPPSTTSASACGSQAHDSALATQRAGDIKIAQAVESQPLRASEAAKKNAHLARRGNSKNAVVARCRRSGDEKLACGAECQVVGGNRRLERREHKNFALGADLENRAAAVAHVQAAALVEGDASGDAHALDPLHRSAVGRNAVHRAIVAAGDEQVAVRDREPGPWD